MPEPATPSPAATLVLLRDRPAGGFETLLIQRHSKSKFAAGDYVFAGGKVERDDVPPDGERLCVGLTAAAAAGPAGRRAEAARGPGLLDRRHSRGLRGGRPAPRLWSHRCAAAPRRDQPPALRGLPGRLSGVEYRLLRHAARRAPHPRHRPARLLRSLDHARGAAPALRHALLRRPGPLGQEPEVDGHEIVNLRWLSPKEAVDAFHRNEINAAHADSEEPGAGRGVSERARGGSGSGAS